MLENTLSSYTAQIEGLIEWIITRVSKYLTIETCEVTLTPFKLTDDEGLRQLLGQLVTAGKSSVSTLLESYGMDYDDELEKIKEDTVSEAINSAKMQLEVDRAVFLAATQMVDKFDQNNDYRTALTKAQQITEQIHETDMSVKRQVMNQLQVEDFPMYLMVSKMLEEYTQAGMSQQQMEQGTDPSQPGSQGQNQPGGSGGNKSPGTLTDAKGRDSSFKTPKQADGSK